MSEEKCQRAEDSRTIHKDLTLAMIRNAKAEVIIQLEHAYQLPNEDPREFDAYLHTLEQQLAALRALRELFSKGGESACREEERALVFFANLLPELRLKIQELFVELPDTRDRMVTVATRCHSLLRMRESRLKREEARRSREGKHSKPKGRRRNADSDTKNRRNRKRNRNRTVKHGHPLKCYSCGSEDHLADRCI
ncbi:hypothetical protein CDV55_102886 [Aspergillus turcosus]|nr:hypothetical protein CDV55_102886 [Aspergillus turcosus]